MMEGRTGPVSRLTAILIAVAALAVAGPAGAKTVSPAPGVHIDPGSPAAKEYAIPLGVARTGSGSGGNGSTQLFGAGITKASSPPPGAAPTGHAATTGRAVAGRGHHPAAKRRTRSGAVTPASAPGTGVPPPQRVLDTGGGAGSGIAWMLAAAAAVLLLGALGGLALARRDRRTIARIT
jgi:hypothetical protein